MAALHSVQAQKEASGKVEGCGAPVEAAPADARRHGRPPHRRAALFGFPPLKEEATAQAILTRRTLLRAGASAAVTPFGCIEGASVPIAEAPLHSGIARLDAKARQEGAALRDPGAPPQPRPASLGLRLHPRCAHAMPQCVTRDPDCQEVGPKLTAKCWLLDKQPQEEYASAIA